MSISQSSLAASALFILAGCGGSGGGGSLGGFSVATLAGQATVSEGPTDTASVSLVGDGVAGVLAVAPGLGTSAGLQSIKIRADGDYQRIYVSLNGGAEFALDATFSSDANGGGYGPTGLNGNYVGVTNIGNLSLLARTQGESGGFGYAGIMTPVVNLETSPVTYSGNWTGYVNPSSLSNLTSGAGGGSMTLTFDPNANTMDGTFSGDLNLGAFSGSTVYPVSGIVDADLTDGVFAGTMLANTGVYQGSAALGGAIYGFNADDAAGAFAGSINGGAGDHAFYGVINLELD